MTIALRDLNELSEADASKLLMSCCGSSRWVSRMVAQRPFSSRAQLLSAADEIWKSLSPDDWREAFSHHPRIGDRASGTAAREQSGMTSAADKTRSEMARINEEYERRFGYIYIVCATGKSGEEMLALAKERLNNDPDNEIQVAQEEQREITRLRLAKLVEDEH